MTSRCCHQMSLHPSLATYALPPFSNLVVFGTHQLSADITALFVACRLALRHGSRHTQSWISGGKVAINCNIKHWCCEVALSIQPSGVLFQYMEALEKNQTMAEWCQRTEIRHRWVIVAIIFGHLLPKFISSHFLLSSISFSRCIRPPIH